MTKVYIVHSRQLRECSNIPITASNSNIILFVIIQNCTLNTELLKSKKIIHKYITDINYIIKHLMFCFFL